MLRKFEIDSGRVVESASEESPILVFANPDLSEKKKLVETYKIDEQHINYALDPEELARLELEPGCVSCFLKIPKNYSAQDHFLFKVSTLGAFLVPERLILVLGEDISLFDGKSFMKTTALSDLLLNLLYRVICHFLGHLKTINMICDELEKKINRAMENKHLINLFTLEKSLVYYLNAINSNGVLIDKIKLNAARLGFDQERVDAINEITIENTQCCKQAEVYSNILASLMDARVSIVSNNLNVLIKMLNIITIGIMVPTLVVSIFSMNVTLPFQQFHHAFWVIMSFAIISGLGVFFMWKYFRW
ncbi:MAG: magnesium transporter CorA family protein [Candidatus Aureabacteria bacterium]|nr:magnesium transporter CorA family protein [Candidatus Auribacterota bacterium]